MVTLPEIVHPNPSLRWRLNPPRIQTQRQSGRCEQADENQDCEDQSGDVEASGHHVFLLISGRFFRLMGVCWLAGLEFESRADGGR